MIKSHTVPSTIITTGAADGNPFFLSRPEQYDGLSSIGIVRIVFLVDCCCCCSFAKNVNTSWSASALDGGNVSTREAHWRVTHALFGHRVGHGKIGIRIRVLFFCIRCYAWFESAQRWRRRRRKKKKKKKKSEPSDLLLIRIIISYNAGESTIDFHRSQYHPWCCDCCSLTCRLRFFFPFLQP